MNNVAVIIVNWNTGTLLRDCVASLVALPERERISDIVVVDSASTDTSVARLEQWLAHQAAPGITVLKQSRNIGFAHGNNLAIRQLQERYGQELPHILLLNPDTLVSAGAIARLLQELEQHSSVGIVGPTLHNRDGSLQPSVRRFPTLPIIVTFLLKLPRLVRHTRWWQNYLASDHHYQSTQDVDQIMGAAFLIRRELLLPNHSRTVGLLDEQFFVWWEEVDYCLRARAAGWRIRYVPTPPVTHYGGVSFAQLVGLKRTLPWLKSLKHFTHKHWGVLASVLVILLSPINILLALPAAFFHHQQASHL